MSLPLEICELIYLKLLPDVKQEVITGSKHIFQRIDNPLPVTSLVNRQVYDEIASKIYRQGLWVKTCSCSLPTALGSLRMAIRYIRSLSVGLRPYHVLDIRDGRGDRPTCHPVTMRKSQLLEENLSKIVQILDKATCLRSLDFFWGGLFETRSASASTKPEPQGRSTYISEEHATDSSLNSISKRYSVHCLNLIQNARSRFMWSIGIVC